MLFGIDTGARVLPWEYDEPTPEDQLLTRQSFLERIPAMSHLHLSGFRDYPLDWAEDTYQALEDDGLIGEYLIDLTRGKYISSPVERATDVVAWTRARLPSPLVGTYASLLLPTIRGNFANIVTHRCLSASLDYVTHDIEPCEIFDMGMIEGFNEKICSNPTLVHKEP